jgi:hypothetical protein
MNHDDDDEREDRQFATNVPREVLRCDGTCRELGEGFDKWMHDRQQLAEGLGATGLDTFHMQYFDISEHAYIKMLMEAATNAIGQRGFNFMSLNNLIEAGLYLEDRRLKRSAIASKECAELTAMVGDDHTYPAIASRNEWSAT